MALIYVPTKYKNNCNVVYNGYIRSYTNNNHTQWDDIYINQDYMIKSGSTNYSQTVVCDDVNGYTDNFYYRTDFDKICLITIIILFVTIYPMYLLLKTFRKRL